LIGGKTLLRGDTTINNGFTETLRLIA